MSALTFTDDGLIQRFANQLGVLGANAPIAPSRAVWRSCHNPHATQG